MEKGKWDLQTATSHEIAQEKGGATKGSQ